MSLLLRLYRLLRTIANSNPLIIALKKWKYQHHFANAEYANLFHGIYQTFDEAKKYVPVEKTIGYDHTGPATMYGNRLERVFPADYPVLFWLKQIMKDSQGLFDLGGHVGIAYYAYKKYIDYPQNYKWLVCDVPAVTDKGEKLAKENNDTTISFTNDLKMGDGFDIVFASGSLQYIDEHFSNIIEQYNNKPSYIIINLLPLHDEQTYVTLQNIGTTFCPYRIFDKNEFIKSITSKGYELVDIWENAEKSLTLPFHPEKDLNCYYGLYFKKNK